MSSVHEDMLIAGLYFHPRLNSIVDDELPHYREKYHKTLRLTAGFMAAYGHVHSETMDSKETEEALWDIIAGLQRAGIIPKSTPVVTLSWYVLKWVVIPFIRAMLKKYPRTNA